MKKINSSFWLLFFFLAPVYAQDKTIIYEASDEIVWAGVDRASDLMIILKSGEVQKINKEGKKIGSYLFKTPPTLLDPLDGAQSFYFSRPENTYGNISSDLTIATQTPLDPAFAISPWLVCPALHELWILDGTDFSLKKTKLKATAIGFETPLNHAPSKRIDDYISLREYQNYIFLLDKDAGILMFNGLGKYIKTIGERDIKYFSFIGEEIYFLSGNGIVLVDLYTDERRVLPLPVACQFALLIDDRIYTVSGKRVTIMEFKP